MKPVLRLGHPVLREKARALSRAEVLAPEFKEFVKDVYDTMKAEDGIGLAAPQIGVSVRACGIELPEEEFQMFINPEWKFIESEQQGFWEGCLSVPGMRGFVERPSKLQVKYRDLEFKEHTIEVEGFLATVFQHEFDHLDGTLYIDRMKPDENGALPFAYNEEFEQFVMPETDEDEVLPD